MRQVPATRADRSRSATLATDDSGTGILPVCFIESNGRDARATTPPTASGYFIKAGVELGLYVNEDIGSLDGRVVGASPGCRWSGNRPIHSPGLRHSSIPVVDIGRARCARRE